MYFKTIINFQFLFFQVVQISNFYYLVETIHLFIYLYKEIEADAVVQPVK